MVPGHNANSQEFIMAKTVTAKSTAKPTPAKASEALQDTRSAEQAPAPKTPKVKRDRSTLYANYKPVLTDVITLVSGGKAKKANSKAADKFALYGTGNITVGDVLKVAKERKLKPSIRWDWAHNLIQINGKAYVA